MGNALSSVSAQTRQSFRILVCGPESSGKTTLIYQLKLGQVVTTVPTHGFNVESLDVGGITWVLWDIGARGAFAPLHRHYYQNTQALIFVVDASDTTGLRDAADCLHKYYSSAELNNLPVLVLANKQDKETACTDHISSELRLGELSDHEAHLQACCITSGHGLPQALVWIAHKLTGRKPDINLPHLIIPPTQWCVESHHDCTAALQARVVAVITAMCHLDANVWKVVCLFLEGITVELATMDWQRVKSDLVRSADFGTEWKTQMELSLLPNPRCQCILS